MRIVVDTNVVISGVFFRGAPSRVVKALVDGEHEAFATAEILEEYREVVERMLSKKQGRFDREAFAKLAGKFCEIPARTAVEVCRDPDDDKFIGCAIDAEALYIVSGDKDLLDIREYEGVKMVAAADFCERYL